MERNDSGALHQVADELRLQAWLAKAEVDNPSDHEPAVFERLHVLARARDHLRVQAALGKLEAKDEWEHLEGRWRRLMSLVGHKARDLKEDAHVVMDDIHHGYERLRGPRPG